MLFIQDHNVIECTMGYGPSHGFEFFIKVLEKTIFQCIIMCMS